MQSLCSLYLESTPHYIKKPRTDFLPKSDGLTNGALGYCALGIKRLSRIVDEFFLQDYQNI